MCVNVNLAYWYSVLILIPKECPFIYFCEQFKIISYLERLLFSDSDLLRKTQGNLHFDFGMGDADDSPNWIFSLHPKK